jgi:D-alanyl-D-alanine carboxypeptidase/D-alanyl-D-alanine-endopeptidase (penicillin-binding protein 4)
VLRKAPLPVSGGPVRRAVTTLLVVLVAAGCSPPPVDDGGVGPPAVTRSHAVATTPSRAVAPSDHATPGRGAGTAATSATISPLEPEPSIDNAPVEAPWMEALDTVAGGPNVSVAVGVGDTIVYAHGGVIDRIPASGEKLLTSIAALETFGPSHRFTTVAASPSRVSAGGVVRGDLWLIGGGDPELGPERLDTLAERLTDAGVRRVEGSVVGDTSSFSRRWWAPGWIEGLSRRYIRRPTALTFAGNVSATPELEAARALTDALRSHGVIVDRGARVGATGRGLRTLAHVGSAPLRDLLARQNHASSNLHAEVLLRAIGADAGVPTTAGGADVVETVAAADGLDVRVVDGSGLSHRNAVSAIELTSLLLVAASSRWGPALEASLPGPGEGTLGGRLIGVPVRAKTGTLFTVPCSTLAGYVRDAGGRRVAFAVLSDGIAKGSSIAVEDAVVRILASAHVA